VNHPLQHLCSEHQVIQTLKRHCGFVAAEDVVLGEECQLLALPGQEDVIQTEVKAQYVPFRDSLLQMFLNTEIRNMLEVPFVPSQDDKIKSVRDGLMWKNDEFFKEHPNALIVQMYFDDVELVNPLSSRTSVHKVTNFYWTLLNIPEHLRSSLKSIGLISSCKSNLIKKFGYCTILSDFFGCIEQLQSDEGLMLKLTQHETIYVHGSLFCLNGDGLALNHIGGFKGIAGAKKPCRNCTLSSSEMKLCYVEKHLRTLETHLSQLELLSDPNLNVGERKELGKLFGLSGPSVLSRLINFDLTKKLLQDLMHNLLEGVADVAIRELISFLLTKGNSDLTLETLNNKLDCFPYPDELKKNKPSVITTNHLSAHLRQKAAQMMCLLCVLPVILAPFENIVNKENLLNLGLISQITHRLLAYEVHASSINTIKFMILMHHTRFRKLYPNAPFTHKFHFLVHAPSTILNFGGCRVSWCMRFEGLNAWFSQAAGDTKNFMNITKTLTQRFQMKRCLDFGLGDPNHVVLSDKIFKFVISAEINLQNYEMGIHVANCLQVEFNCVIHAASSVHVNNFELNQNTVLMLTDNEEDLPVFCKVKALFVKDDRTAVVVNIFDTVHFDEMRCAFEVEVTEKHVCLSTSNFPTLQPFPLVHTSFGDFIVPLYYDVKVFDG